MQLAFTVFGRAEPKGSTKAFAYPLKNRRTGQPVIGGNGKPVYAAATTSDNPANKGWQQLVAEGANRAIGALAPEQRAVIEGPVRLVLAFFLPRPASAPKRVTLPTKKPDADKLARSCVDALTHVVWRDDSQVVDLVVIKRFAIGPPHVDIVVEEAHGGYTVADAQLLFETVR